MVKIKIISDKLHRKWIKIRLQPIRIFCLHHVCKQFDGEVMSPCDWIEISVFQSKINDLRKQGYKFISLTEAHMRLKNDYIRTKEYAVLTFDDGYKSLLEIIPWLEEQNIPATLFVNGKYLDGNSYRVNPQEEYLTHIELFSLDSYLIEIGHHGWEHMSAHDMDENEFRNSLERNVKKLNKHPRYIPFWAYTWGDNNDMSNDVLKKYNITPVVIKGGKNYKFNGYIDRELL